MTVLEPGRAKRKPPHRLRRRIGYGLAALVVAAIALLVFMASRVHDPTPTRVKVTTTHAPPPRPHRIAYATAPATEQLRIRGKLRLRSGLLFDVHTGRVLWSRHPTARLPIASLTKMMTALVVAAHTKPSDQVMITRQAVHFSGSGVGLLPRGKRVSVRALLYGLLLPSGNDAAIALAQHVAGTQARFLALMNQEASTMGLACTHFDTVSGIVDQGNYSCARDLAALAHAVLRQPRLGRIVASRSAILPFPIKGGKLYLYNNNPLLLMRYRGADGVKTGYTVAAGPCLVAAARRGRHWFGLVLLHSANPPAQAQRLLDAAFAGARRA